MTIPVTVNLNFDLYELLTKKKEKLNFNSLTETAHYLIAKKLMEETEDKEEEQTIDDYIYKHFCGALDWEEAYELKTKIRRRQLL